MRAYFFLLPCLVLSGVLSAQGIYLNSNKPDASVCPRLLRDKTSMEFRGYGQGADSSLKTYYQQGVQYFLQGQRKDVSVFTAYDDKDRPTSIASLKGKVVLVGLWSVHCQPSARMLMEFSRIYPKQAQYGFQLLAVNFDATQQDGGHIQGGWPAIDAFMTDNRRFFQASKLPVYTSGVGKEGAANFMDTVYSLPVLFVVDREGRLAQIHIGYQNGFVGKSLMQALAEHPAPAPPAAAPMPRPAPPAPATAAH